MSAVMANRAGDALQRWVCFRVGGQDYGLPIERVQEVLRDAAIEPVPGTTALVLGVINLRGQIVTVLDLRERLALPVGADVDPAATRIIVLDIAGERFGFRVDAVADVLKLADAAIKPAPGVGASSSEVRVAGLYNRERRLLTLLDADSLLLGATLLR
jgi:purine-binding chemotaxis protein CheW